MPKFFVTTDDGDSTFRDEDGLEFKNRKAATDDAQRALVDMARERLPNGERVALQVQIEDEVGDEVYRASLKFEGDTLKEEATSVRSDEEGDGDEPPTPPT
ncbi:hypothetical protein DWF00_16655 [Bosea caraganae]|nr:hypothetical protein [Bosea caraganae]RDJ24852.1 hypothetical protein DWF00_16655 [Bosea caraganae]